MKLKSAFAKPFASMVAKRVNRWASIPIETQEKTFQKLLKVLKYTKYGMDHGITGTEDYNEFQQKIPIRDYEGIKGYVEEILKGKANVLWKGKPIYFSKTSGTTSGVKFIPITKESMPNHITNARNALLCYIAETGKAQFANGKLIFLSGSPTLTEKKGFKIGRLSGIVNHHIPSYLKKNQLPSYDINCEEDWEKKVDAIADETLDKDMTLIGGIPPWVQMYFDVLKQKTGSENILDIFPNFKLFVYGGVNFAPYKEKLFSTIGKQIDSIELYPASEGFIAYQNTQKEEGLLLILDQGIFYEFIRADEFHNENPKRVSLKDVELDVNYALILNTNAGLWGYNIGDTVKFVSKTPYKILVTGRIKHFISAFGEHVIGEEVEWAMKQCCKEYNTSTIEFTVAPMVTPESGLPYHQWFVEFENAPEDMSSFAERLDFFLQEKNSYYKDLITGSVLQTLKITSLKSNSFREYMKSQGKLGGQNKVPRLANDRKIADALEAYKI
jgi:hypothetical protein